MEQFLPLPASVRELALSRRLAITARANRNGPRGNCVGYWVAGMVPMRVKQLACARIQHCYWTLPLPPARAWLPHMPQHSQLSGSLVV